MNYVDKHHDQLPYVEYGPTTDGTRCREPGTIVQQITRISRRLAELEEEHYADLSERINKYLTTGFINP